MWVTCVCRLHWLLCLQPPQMGPEGCLLRTVFEQPLHRFVTSLCPFCPRMLEMQTFLLSPSQLATRRCYFQSELTYGNGAPQIVQFVMFCTVTNHILLYLNVMHVSVL